MPAYRLHKKRTSHVTVTAYELVVHACTNIQTFASFFCCGTFTVNTRSLTVNRKSSAISDSIVLEDAMRTPSELDTITRSTPRSSVFNMSAKSPTVLVTGRNVNWQSSRLDGNGTVTAGSPRLSSTRISGQREKEKEKNVNANSIKNGARACTPENRRDIR